MNHAVGVWIGWCLLLALPVRAATAEPQPTVMPCWILETVPRGAAVNADDLAAVHRLLGDSLAAVLSAFPVQSDELLTTLQQGITDKDRTALQRANKLLQQGRENLLNLSLEEALEALQRARIIFRQTLHCLDDPEPLISTLMALGEAFATMDRLEDAQTAYREVLVLSPDYEPDPGQVPSKLRSLFDRVRAAADQESRGGLSITTDPSDAVVILDGLKAGTSPLEKNNVPVGLHALIIKKEGHETSRSLLEVKTGELATVFERLKPLLVPDLHRRLLGALRGLDRTEDPVLLMKQLLQVAPVSAIVASQLSRNSDQQWVLSLAVVQNAAEKSPRRLGLRFSPSAISQAGEALQGKLKDALDKNQPPGLLPQDLGLDYQAWFLGEPLETGGKDLQKKDDKLLTDRTAVAGRVESAKPFWRQWWFWAGSGALVAAGIGTTLAIVLRPSPKVIYDPNQVQVKILINP
jgi:tetratricopeptide (TPR) repeat protein